MGYHDLNVAREQLVKTDFRIKELFCTKSLQIEPLAWQFSRFESIIIAIDVMVG